jgi:hypothetical protein
MTLGAMQPYLLPYLGFYQLIQAVDSYLICDDLQYTDGWMKRNRSLLDCKKAKPNFFGLPVKHAAQDLKINEREFSEQSPLSEKNKLLAYIDSIYLKAPHYQEHRDLLKAIILYPDNNVGHYNAYGIKAMANYLDINTKIIISSQVDDDDYHLTLNSYSCQEMVLYLCKYHKANHYINALGGVALYDKSTFAQHDIVLNFIKMDTIRYQQYSKYFVEGLSIIDVLAFHTKEEVKELLNRYTLI